MEDPVKPTYVYVPSTNVEESARFYRDVLGLTEAWREGDDTVAFRLPDSDLQLMVSTSTFKHGPMYAVSSVAEWISQHADLEITVPVEEIPGGSVAGFADPAGNTFYVFDQK
jgi:predicted enzyme related to lactoylglutathione lyase